jgi:7-cyano-7-deazaguanine reductase
VKNRGRAMQDAWVRSGMAQTASAGTGYTDEHARAGIDAELPALDVWPNQFRGYEITIAIPEYTSVCPKTGLPDFGEIRITYVPADLCIELKSLKYYMFGFRNRGIFFEAATNAILDDLVKACQPRRMTVVGDFAVRGGMKTVVTATYQS